MQRVSNEEAGGQAQRAGPTLLCVALGDVCSALLPRVRGLLALKEVVVFGVSC